jgi:hypothetical protein
MVKITLENGTVLEGSVEELRQMGVKLPEQVKPLEVGDYAKVTQEFHRQNGTIVKLKAYERPGSSFPFRSVNLDGSEGDIFDHLGLTRATDEEVAEAKKQAQPETITHGGVEYKRVDREAREGDVVVFTETTSGVVANKTPYVADSGLRVTSGWPVYNDLANRTPANVKVYEQIVTKPAPLQVGDYAKVVGNDPTEIYKDHQFTLGEIVEIGNKATFEDALRCDSLGVEECQYDFVNPINLVRATDEEVAEAKRQQAEKAVADKWAEIGRKQNEFKVGDIVRIVASVSSQLNGTIGEVGEVRGKESFRVMSPGFTHGNWQGHSNVQLITPVEQRFDKPGGDSE